MEMPYKTVIVANGVFPSCSRALEFLRHAGHIICCDGAVGKLTAAGFTPSVVVGDLDSLSPDERQRWSDRLHPDYSTEYNDLQPQSARGTCKICCSPFPTIRED